MPKQKTHKGTKDRVRITKNGKVLRGSAMTNHFLRKKSASKKRTFAIPGQIIGKEAKNIKRNLGV